MELFVVFVATLIAAILVRIVAALWQPVAIEEEADSHAISEAEFLALCKPGTNPRVALKVRRMVADNLGVHYERIRPSDHFEKDYGAC